MMRVRINRLRPYPLAARNGEGLHRREYQTSLRAHDHSISSGLGMHRLRANTYAARLGVMRSPISVYPQHEVTA
jgi:hypothetical protein